MDIVTLNKIISNFDYSTTCLIDSSFLASEIDDLVSLSIIKELDDGRYKLDKNQLYRYAKDIAKKGNYSVAIAIYNYLLGFQDQNSKSWFFTINYQLFKLYINNNELSKAYSCFKQGFDKKTDYYPAILNMLDYLLKTKREVTFDSEELNKLFSNKKFNEIKDVFSKKNINSTESNKKMFNLVCDMTIEVEEKIDQDIANLIKKKDFKELSNYIRTVIKAHRSNETIRFIGFLSETFDNITSSKDDSQLNIKKFYDIVNMFQSYNMDKVIKEYELDYKYRDTMYSLLKYMLVYLSKEGYHKNLNKYANRRIRNVVNKNRVVILDNLADYGNILALDTAMNNSEVNIESVIYNGSKKLIITKANPDVIDFDREDIIKLFDSRQNKECLSYCLKYIESYPDDFEIYQILIECYNRLGNKEEAKKITLLGDIRSTDLSSRLTMEEEAKFYGINDIGKIIDFISKYNVPIEIAGLNFGLNDYQLEILAMLLSRYSYAINDVKQADYYLECVSMDDQYPAVMKYLDSEINNPNSYIDIDYNDVKEQMQKLELKK